MQWPTAPLFVLFTSFGAVLGRSHLTPSRSTAPSLPPPLRLKAGLYTGSPMNQSRWSFEVLFAPSAVGVSTAQARSSSSPLPLTSSSTLPGTATCWCSWQGITAHIQRPCQYLALPVFILGTCNSTTAVTAAALPWWGAAHQLCTLPLLCASPSPLAHLNRLNVVNCAACKVAR
jgi:hypothetical protein